MTKHRWEGDDVPEKHKTRIAAELKKHGFTDVVWTRSETVEANHKSLRTVKPKGFVEILQRLGYCVVCGGIAIKAYAQVWSHPKKAREA